MSNETFADGAIRASAGNLLTTERTEYPVLASTIPDSELRQGTYSARFARTALELKQVLRLRFEVFNIELGEGLDDSFLTGLDEDRYDAVCHHAVVFSDTEPGPVGTIRLQTSEMAAEHFGFYSATEFDLRGLPRRLRRSSIEMGRACIARPHRNKIVLFLLWKALACYLSHNEKRFLFGCCSLNSQDPAQAVAALEQFHVSGQVDKQLMLSPNDGFDCPSATDRMGAAVEIPTLFKTYLRYGARVCSAPALDRAFKTIDFFVVLDVNDLDPRKRRLFFS